MQLERDQLLLILITLMVLAIIVEIAISLGRKSNVYNLKESLSNIQLGIGQQAVNALVFPFLILLFNAIQTNFGLFSISSSNPLNWIALILLSDFLYYCAHRASHRVNILVGAHIAHHQAEDYNFISAFRQSWSAHIFIFPFFLPLAILGFKIEMFMLTQLATMFVQFFSHNGTLNRNLGILEYIIVTPRAHRAHHGTAPKYIDSNCGGIFIIWDRLFGTYSNLEEDEIEIGILGKMNHYDPIHSNLNYFKRIFFVMKARKGLFNKVSILFQTPEKLGAELKELNYKEDTLKEIETTGADLFKLGSSLVGALVLTVIIMAFGKNLLTFQKALLCIVEIYFLSICGKEVSKLPIFAKRLSLNMPKAKRTIEQSI